MLQRLSEPGRLVKDLSRNKSLIYLKLMLKCDGFEPAASDW